MDILWSVNRPTMLHEVLLALSGYPGCLFVETEGNYSVVKDVPFIHPSEVAILERLCKLISHNKFIMLFISKHGQFKPPNVELDNPESFNPVASSQSSGLYLRALCHGLDLVLQPYQRLLLQIEENVLKDPHLPLSHLQRPLEEYYLLFPALVHLLTDINEKDMHGCHVLDVIHAHLSSGIPVVQRAMKIIMRVCHSVMFKQLSAWLLYGLLMDPHKEFFIQKMASSSSSSKKGSAKTNSESNIMQFLGGQYYLQPTMLPIYIPTSLAEKICFVGESIQLLECREHRNQSFLHKGIILGNKDHFALRFHHLQEQEEFHYRQFEDIINEVRTCVAEQLWRLVVEVGLSNHLHSMKDFFLLGRGELFQAFIDQAGSMLLQPATASTEHNVNMAFQSAARSVLLEDESFLDKFHFVIKSKKEESNSFCDIVEFHTKGSNEIGWSNISLKYNVPWPLHIVFTSAVLEKYNMVFRFLLHVKRVQLELQHCWTLQMQWKKQRYEDSYPPAWNLRTLMAFVVDNLQYYLQVDVLESQFSLLVEKMDCTHDFEAIKHAHEQFVVCLLAQTFLSSKAIGQRISELLDLCLTFCQQFSIAASLPTRLATDRSAASFSTQLSTFSKKVTDLQKQFQRQAALLFQVLSSAHTYQATPFVAQFLLRLDFNKFFSSGQLSM